MLKDQPWIWLAPEMQIEWKQAKDEGRDVRLLKAVCEEVAKRAKTDNKEEMAKALKTQLDHAPKVKGYPFIEPSDYPSIQTHKPNRRHRFEKIVSEGELKDKLSGAWIGRISGCLLGKPVEGMQSKDLHKLLKESNNFPMNRYLMRKDFSEEWLKKTDPNRGWADMIDGCAPIDDDTNYTVLALKLLQQVGKEFTSNDVLEAWLTWLPMLATCTAERIAYKNAASGLLAPETATHNNPYREWIGAQIRADFFGYINVGHPDLAAEMAFRDASISHIKNGIYGEMFVAALIAAASVCENMVEIIEAGLDEIPARSRLRKDIQAVLEWFEAGWTYDQVISQIHKLYDESDGHGWCHTNPNAMIVVSALLYGENDFGKSLCLAVQPGFDTDCNGATTGSIMGIMLGEKMIPQCWIDPHQNTVATSIQGYPTVTVEALVEATIKVIQ